MALQSLDYAGMGIDTVSVIDHAFTVVEGVVTGILFATDRSVSAATTEPATPVLVTTAEQATT